MDYDLFFARNERPTCTPGAAFAVYPLPSAADPSVLSTVVGTDLGRGKPIYAHFRVKTQFAGDALNVLRFCILGSTQSDLSTPTILARGPDMFTAVLLPSVEVELVMPVPTTLIVLSGSPNGFGYYGLGIEALVPTTDWAFGGLEAWLDEHPTGVQPVYYRSGY